MNNTPIVDAARLAAIAAIATPIAQQHVDTSYQQLLMLALEDLAQQSHSALGGKAAGWAGGVLWALFEHNLYHGAPQPVGAALQAWFGVSANTLRHRRREVAHLLALSTDQGLAKYMHAELYELLEQAIGQTATSHAPDQTNDADAATQFDRALNLLLQQSPNGVQMADVEALAAQFGLTIHMSEP